MKRGLAYAALAVPLLSGPAMAQTGVGAPAQVTLTPFVFQTSASRNPDFDPSPYTYPSGDLEGQVNPNTGDIRIEGIGVNGVIYAPEQLQLVTGARILVDDAVDVVRGGNNLAAGRGIGADVDDWTGEGVTTTTPTEADLVANHGNLNLTSIVATREGAGTTVFELSFDQPTDHLFIWERGRSGDVLVSALDDAGQVLGSYKVLDGANDGEAVGDYVRTGITVTTYVLEDFLNQGQELGSVGLRLSEPARAFRFTAYQEAEGEGAVRYNGPDLKVLALAPASDG